MRILVSGSTGLVGSALVPALEAEGHQVVRLVRGAGHGGEASVAWNPAEGILDAGALEGIDAAVHLAGESLMGRWTPAKKQAILESRTVGTRLLAATLARLGQPPRVLISASAVGYYGDRGDEVLREESAPGDDFLACVCREWEEATSPARDAGVRVVPLRFGMILAPRGGALGEMLLPFRLGLGGRLASGRQWMSWIALDDVVGAIRWILGREAIDGAANAVSPKPVTNAEFTRVLARVLRRPALFVAPALGLRLAFGEMAETVLLASQRVEPARLLDSGYAFLFPDLEPALRHLLRQTQSR